MNKIMIIFFSLLFLVGCSHLNNKTNAQTVQKKSTESICQRSNISSKKTNKPYAAKGVASWYGGKFHKRKTSSGERFNMYQLTAAHKTLPLSTYVKVTNLKNGRHVVVKVNDRGPFVRNRLIDVSFAAAKELGMVNRGTAPVSIQSVCV